MPPQKQQTTTPDDDDALPLDTPEDRQWCADREREQIELDKKNAEFRRQMERQPSRPAKPTEARPRVTSPQGGRSSPLVSEEEVEALLDRIVDAEATGRDNHGAPRSRPRARSPQPQPRAQGHGPHYDRNARRRESERARQAALAHRHPMPTFLRGVGWVLELGVYRHLTPSERDLLFALVHYGGHTKKGAWASIELMAARIDRKAETVSQALARLIERGIVVQRGHRNGKRLHFIRLYEQLPPKDRKRYAEM